MQQYNTNQSFNKIMFIFNKNFLLHIITWLITIVFLSLPVTYAAQAIVNIADTTRTADVKTPVVVSLGNDNMPTQADINMINTDLDIMLKGMISGDADIFVEKTHPALFPLLGGKENFRKFTQEALLKLDSMGVKILSTQLQKPGQFYPAGNEMLSIVERTTVMDIKGQKIKSTGFMVAIKNTETNSWTYLDGSGLREDESMLWKMFPELSADIPFPESKVETIQPL